MTGLSSRASVIVQLAGVLVPLLGGAAGAAWFARRKTRAEAGAIHAQATGSQVDTALKLVKTLSEQLDEERRRREELERRLDEERRMRQALQDEVAKLKRVLVANGIAVE